MTSRPRTTPALTDRAVGALVGTAAGDALGAGYEFGPPLPDDAPVGMIGGGGFGWAPGEWTDDTSMAVPIARAAARGADLRDPSTHDEIVAAWIDWARTAPDVGVQTRSVLSTAGALGGDAAAAVKAARQLYERSGRSAGNGSLMRTAPVALAHLGDPSAIADAARAISGLTHYDDDAGDACVIWSVAIGHAIVTGTLSIDVGINALPAERRDRWAALVREAEQSQPRDFDRNGWVVHALQGAWSSIHHAGVAVLETGAPRATALRDGLGRAVRGGRDTDTVAAIAGGMLGAVHGASATPAAWRRLIHGWPGLDTRGLTELAVQAVRGGDLGAGDWPLGERMDYAGWGARATLTAHPHDEGVLLGSIVDLDAVLDGSAGIAVDAVVSLCRVGRAQRAETHVEQWLIDDPEDGLNPNLDFVLADTIDVIAELRSEGKTVLVHCVQAQSRTPSIAALYAVRQFGVGVDEAFDAVGRVLPGARPQAFLVEAVRRLATRSDSSPSNRPHAIDPQAAVN